MKNLHTLLAVASLGLLVGCANGSSPVPEPTPSAPSAPTESKTNQVGVLPGDVAPSVLHARDGISVAKQLVQVSQPVSPKDPIGDEGAPEWVVTTDALAIVGKGTATSAIAIDDTSGEAHLFLGPQSDDATQVDAALGGIQVLDPDGNVINQRAPKVGIAKPKPMSMIPLAGHKPGIYTIKHTSVSQRFGTALDVRQPNSKLVMKLKPSTLEHLLGNDTAVDVLLEDDGKPVTGATLASQLLDPTLAPGSRLLFKEIAPGHYRANVAGALGAADPTGAWLVDVRAEGKTAAGLPFLRHGRTGFHFGIPTAKVTSISATRVVKDGDGKVVAFEVDVALESKSLDRLEISGTLAAMGEDGHEHPVALAFTGAAYGAGTHTATLRFDAGHVRLTHLEGPYHLRNLKLFSLGTDTLFQRVGSGLNQSFVGPRIAEMVMPQMTGAIEQMITDGTLFAK